MSQATAQIIKYYHSFSQKSALWIFVNFFLLGMESVADED